MTEVINENNEAVTKLLAFIKEFYDKAPPEVKEGLIPGVFASLSIITKFIETHKISAYSDRWMTELCPIAESQLATKTNLFVGIGTAMEIISLVGQYWRLKEFTKLLKDAANLRDESKIKIKEAADHLNELEILIKEYDSFYIIHGKTMKTNAVREMTIKGRYINDKLNDVKECINNLKISIGNTIENLQFRNTGIAIDSVSGALSGTLSIVSVFIAAGICNPIIGAGAIIVGGLRLTLGLIGAEKYSLSKEMIIQLQEELDLIQELGERHKMLKEAFYNLENSIRYIDLPDGSVQIQII